VIVIHGDKTSSRRCRHTNKEGPDLTDQEMRARTKGLVARVKKNCEANKK
jgi:hypothetical protein